MGEDKKDVKAVVPAVTKKSEKAKTVAKVDPKEMAAKKATAAAAAAKAAEAAKAKEEEDKIHQYRKNAWNDDQYDASNEKTYDIETQKPTRYQFPKGSCPTCLMQDWRDGTPDKLPLPLNEYGEPIRTISYLTKYDHKEHAWTGDFYDEDEYIKETENPTDYVSDIINKAFPSLAQTGTMTLEQLQYADSETQKYFLAHSSFKGFSQIMAKNFDKQTNPYFLYQQSLKAESAKTAHPYRSQAWTADQNIHQNT